MRHCETSPNARVVSQPISQAKADQRFFHTALHGRRNPPELTTAANGCRALDFASLKARHRVHKINTPFRLGRSESRGQLLGSRVIQPEDKNMVIGPRQVSPVFIGNRKLQSFEISAVGTPPLAIEIPL